MDTRRLTQIGYNDGITYIDINPEDTDNKIAIEIYPKLLESDSSEDVVPLQLTVRYLNPATGKKLFEYGGIALFETNGKRTLADDNGGSFKRDLWTNALSFFRGIICEKLRGTGLERFLLPQMSDEDIDKI